MVNFYHVGSGGLCSNASGQILSLLRIFKSIYSSLLNNVRIILLILIGPMRTLEAGKNNINTLLLFHHRTSDSVGSQLF